MRDDGEGRGVAGSWGSIIGLKKAASKDMKQKQGAASSNFGSAASAFLDFGSSEKLENWEEGVGEEAARKKKFNDLGFEVPVVLLDVDDTIRKFKSVVEAEHED